MPYLSRGTLVSNDHPFQALDVLAAGCTRLVEKVEHARAVVNAGDSSTVTPVLGAFNAGVRVWQAALDCGVKLQPWVTVVDGEHFGRAPGIGGTVAA